ncbi:hypothetical protein H8Z72_23775 (plasmid) [Xanthomonas citri pv. citri]|uniref:hypothetical protein n=1 Tax=Xanthomonas citri TaxID=346 RepID=UPI001932595C|nr:hypothetical protein [Xanthomonas citri]QRD62851.1 hypothetical protein H8Z74_24035 [Xanthomonas citri pv. citri]QRD67259.1 hypothetical protein H8Z73_23430 [Xanthomonas citri pv. citri]QRD71846.1 hypothetical protein H8Z72_23775 [Xanthomonas citri pv. citri]
MLASPLHATSLRLIFVTCNKSGAFGGSGLVPQEAADTAQAAPVPVTLLVVSSIVGLWEPVIAHDAVVRNGETQIGSDKCLSSKAAIDTPRIS